MKKISAILITILCLCLTGCGETITNEYGNEVSKIGPYIEISREEGTDFFGNYYYFIIAYDENTNIVYQLAIGGGYRFNIMELHSFDEEGHPILQFYEDGKIVTK